MWKDVHLCPPLTSGNPCQLYSWDHGLQYGANLVPNAIVMSPFSSLVNNVEWHPKVFISITRRYTVPLAVNAGELDGKSSGKTSTISSFVTTA